VVQRLLDLLLGPLPDLGKQPGPVAGIYPRHTSRPSASRSNRSFHPVIPTATRVPPSTRPTSVTRPGLGSASATRR
jgi:hypothetical protein